MGTAAEELLNRRQVLGNTSGNERYVFGAVIDFLCLGGGSLIIMLGLGIFLPVDMGTPIVAAIGLFLADFINHPHFAHSYQIFYANFSRKAFGSALPFALRVRYLIAAFLVPVVLAGYMTFAALSSDPILLGQTANLMAFLVGWHYVKQGYGILIVDSVLKRNFFSANAKKALLVNAYICWLASWLIVNRFVAEKDLFGLKYYTLGINDELVYSSAALAALTAAWAMYELVKKWLHSENNFPFNGVTAYLTSLYVWLLFVKVNPMFVYIVPGFHSLQYLLVVWRYRLNYEVNRPDEDENRGISILGRFFKTKAKARFAGFVLFGILLGVLGFSVIPNALDKSIDYDKTLFSGAMFLFCFWVFINVHHYFIDNVIWRKDNPETSHYLFRK